MVIPVLVCVLCFDHVDTPVFDFPSACQQFTSLRNPQNCTQITTNNKLETTSPRHLSTWLYSASPGSFVNNHGFLILWFFLVSKTKS